MKNIILTFHRDELLKDIERMADLISHDMSQETHTRHLLADIVQDGNVDRVVRSLSFAFEWCASLLRRFTPTETEDGDRLCNKFGWEETYTLSLSVPDKFTERAAMLAEHLIHEFICVYVLWDYLSLIRPDLAGEWYARLMALEEKIKDAIQMPGGRYHRPLQPF